MKHIVEALLRTIPAVSSMVAFSLVLYLSFAILGVSLFKGQFNACQGEVFDGLSQAQKDLITTPVPFAELTDAQKAWTAVVPSINRPINSSSSNASSNASSSASRSGPVVPYPDLTSRSVCVWLGADWVPTMPQDFNNVRECAHGWVTG
jgi:hypothetical protein